MTTNRLAKVSSNSDFTANGVRHLRACEFAAIAREKGDLKKADLWDIEAKVRGEERIPNGYTVTYISDDETRIVPFRYGGNDGTQAR